jgi:hypothetical protein
LPPTPDRNRDILDQDELAVDPGDAFGESSEDDTDNEAAVQNDEFSVISNRSFYEEETVTSNNSTDVRITNTAQGTTLADTSDEDTVGSTNNIEIVEGNSKPIESQFEDMKLSPAANPKNKESAVIKGLHFIHMNVVDPQSGRGETKERAAYMLEFECPFGFRSSLKL